MTILEAGRILAQRMFDATTAAEDGGEGLPAPEVIALAAEAIGCDSEDLTGAINRDMTSLAALAGPDGPPPDMVVCALITAYGAGFMAGRANAADLLADPLADLPTIDESDAG